MAVQIQLRRDTATNWDATDPILQAGELGVDLTSGRMKLGDGFTQWQALGWYEENVVGADGNVKPSTGPSGVQLDFDPTEFPAHSPLLDGADHILAALASGGGNRGRRVTVDALITRIIGGDWGPSQDFYDDGTFTPVFAATVGNPAATYGSRYGHYARIGNVVVFSLRVQTTAVSGGGGNVRIGNLPFVGRSGVSFGLVSMRHSGVTFGAGRTPYAQVQGDQVALASQLDGGTATSLALAGWGQSGDVAISGAYLI